MNLRDLSTTIVGSLVRPGPEIGSRDLGTSVNQIARRGKLNFPRNCTPVIQNYFQSVYLYKSSIILYNAMNLNEIWHYHRPELARVYLDTLNSGLVTSTTIFPTIMGGVVNA